MKGPVYLDAAPDLSSEDATLRDDLDGRWSTSNRKVQVRVLPGAQVNGIICRSSNGCRRALVIPSVLHGAMIVLRSGPWH